MRIYWNAPLHNTTHLPAFSVGFKLFPILRIEHKVISERQDIQLHITSFSYQQTAHPIRYMYKLTDLFHIPQLYYEAYWGTICVIGGSVYGVEVISYLMFIGPYIIVTTEE